MTLFKTAAAVLGCALLLSGCVMPPAGGTGQKKDTVASTVKRAEQGDAEAQYRIGLMYGSGKHMPKDEVEASRWMAKAAAQGHAGAQVFMGLYYYHGECGYPRDYAKAAEQFRLAAAQGDAQAKHCLALMYLKGQGVRRDYDKSMDLFEQACRGGYADSCQAYQETISCPYQRKKFRRSHPLVVMPGS